ncbi:MAG: T9SS type A sorting domain-containing protein [Aureispira sp.]|nr:T9SS type A sorting domain-containing protein [Aureispira sp.]
MKILILILLMTSLNLRAQVPSLDWAVSMGGVDRDIARSIAVDGNGNVYNVGAFTDTVDFDPGAGVQTLVSNGYHDAYIQKLDVNGNLLWVKQVGGIFDDLSFSIAIDGSGNVYSTGFFENTVDFDPGAGVQTLVSDGFDDIYIQKLDANGNLLWVKHLGGPFYERGNSIAVDGSGNVYTTGEFSNTVDFDPGAGVQNLVSNGDDDIYIQKLDANGNLLWVKQFGDILTDRGSTIQVDSLGNVYSTGFFSGTVDFDPGVAVQNLVSNGGRDIYIQKLDENGNLLWVKQLGGTASDRGLGLVLDENRNVYTTGAFSNTVDFDPSVGVQNLVSNGQYDTYIQKLDENGSLLWVKQLGGPSYDEAYSIAINSNGHVYTTGTFADTVDFDPNMAVQNLTSVGGSYDIFIQKLSQSTITSIELLEKPVPLNLAVYPNPIQDKVNIELKQVIEEVELNLSTITGQYIWSETYQQTGSIQLNLVSLPAGVYVLTLKAVSGQEANIKIVKE